MLSEIRPWYCRLNCKFLQSRFTPSFILKQDFPKFAFFKIEFDQFFFQLFSKHVAMFSRVRFLNFCFVTILQPLIGQKNRKKFECFINNWVILTNFKIKKNPLRVNIANVIQINDI